MTKKFPINLTHILILLIFILLIIMLINYESFVNTLYKVPSLADDVPNIQKLVLPITMTMPIPNSNDIKPANDDS